MFSFVDKILIENRGNVKKLFC